MDKHVFISYAHDDSEFAENLINRVTKEGFTTWIDAEGLHPGNDWREGIDQAIRDAFALIVIMSPDAKSSEYVTYEWAFAWGCGIKVIPVMYRKTDLHPRLDALQYLDFINRSNRPWDQLVKTLKTAASKALEASKALQVATSQPAPSSVPVASTVSNKQKVQEWIAKGVMLLKRKDFNAPYGALEACREAILLDPTNAVAYAYKSEALWRLQKYEEAWEASQLATRLDARLAHAWFCEGNAFSALRKYDEAFSAYNEALRLNPGNADAWIGKGNLWYYGLMRHEEALAAYEQAIQLNPANGEFWHSKSIALEQLGKHEEARQCRQKAYELGYEDFVL